MKTHRITPTAISLLLVLSGCWQREVILDRESLSIGGIRLGAPLKAAEPFGNARQFHEGDAASSADKICFNLKNGGIVVASSNREMGDGTTDAIRIENTDFREKYRNPYEKLLTYTRCGTSTWSIANLKLPHGIELGQTRREVVALLGIGKDVSQPLDGVSTLEYSEATELPIDASFPAWWTERGCGIPTRHYGLSIHLDENDRVIGISVWKTEPSC